MHSRRLLTLVPLTLLALGAGPALGARIATPKLLSPAPNAVVQAVPPFAWAPVAGADQYEFQISADAGFNSPVIGKNEDHFFTKNTRATLKSAIPNGTYYWRVRSVTKGGAVSVWTPPTALKKAWTAAATLQAPAGGAGLAFPFDP